MIDSLTLDQMRVLVAVADAGSFSAAARKLGRVQSAISQSIQTLETTLGVSLFDRSGKTPQLTDAGKALVGDSRALIAGAQAIRARAQSMAEDVEPELTLAVELDAADSAAYGEPEGVARRLPASARVRVHRGSRRRRAAAARRRGPACDLYDRAHKPLRSRERVHDAHRPVARGGGQPSACRPAPADRARGARAARATRADRPHVAHPASFRRDRQPSHLAVRGPGDPPRFPARRLRLVQHAEPHGLRARRGRSAEEAYNRQSRGRRAASFRRA